jgi:hypothetical protein
MGVRGYSAALGRFLTMDDMNFRPGNLDNANLYVAFSSNGPNIYDPSGHEGDAVELEMDMVIDAAVESSNAVSTAGLGAEEGAATSEAAAEYEGLIEAQIEEASGKIPESVEQLQEQQNELVETQQSNLKQAIEENGATGRGEHFNKLGKDWEDITDKTLNEAAPEADIQANPRVGEGTGSQLDHVEDKYSLPQDGSSATRALNQMKNGSNALGENDTLILNVARTPTAEELSNFLSQLPSEVIHNVQVVSTVVDLYNAVRTALLIM